MGLFVMIELGRDLTYEVKALTLDCRVNYFSFSKTDNPGLITVHTLKFNLLYFLREEIPSCSR